MKTRHAEDGSAFRRERFMSAAELDRGLIATGVASRLRVVDDCEQRKLIWWLALASHEPQGLERIARMMIELWPERFATLEMQKLGCGAGRIYNAGEVREVCGGGRSHFTGFELRDDEYCGDLWGNSLAALLDDAYISRSRRDAELEREREWKRQRRSAPLSYPASEFAQQCVGAAERGLAEFLFQQLCLNPAVVIGAKTLWYLPDLLGALRDCHAAWIAEKADARGVTTSVGAAVEETLDYGLTLRGAGQSIVVIDGLARIGKTFAVKAWCERHPGQARYVQVPSSNDDMSFFRAIASALGVGGGRTAKAHELRDKIEDVLQRGDLMLVLDEGHYLWPQRNMRKAQPHRINGLMTQLVNMGAPVAIVTTPQFTKSQDALVKSGGWSSEQFIGRIAHCQRLPDSLPADELREVARTFMPAADAESLDELVDYAQASEKYLAGIESLARRADHLAARDGRSAPTLKDVKQALHGSLVPSDAALFAAVGEPRTARIPKRPAAPLQPAGNSDAEPLQKSCGTIRTSAPTPHSRVKSRGDSSAVLVPK